MISIEGISLFVLLVLAWSVLAIIAWLFKLERYGVTIYPLFLMARSEKLRNVVERLAKRYERFWIFYEKLALAVFPTTMLLSLIYLVVNMFFLIKNRLVITHAGIPVGTSFTPIIPFITIDWRLMLLILISSFVAILPHEIAHGAIAVKNDIKLKSAGFFIFAGAISGGFIEIPEEIVESILMSNNDAEKWNDKKTVEILRTKVKKVLAAGILANIILFLIFMGIYSNYGLLMSLFFEPTGVLVVDTVPGSPAHEANITAGLVIVAINDTPIKTADDLRTFLGSCKPNQTIIIQTDKGVFSVRLSKRDGKVFLGIYYIPWYKSKLSLIPDRAYYDVLSLVYLNYIIQFSIIILNAIPLYVNDGARYLWLIITRNQENTVKKLAYQAINLFSVIILLLTILSGGLLF
ncbi:MAG: site-2 protease family protein [Candidatus Njordarchaeales archaeon]